MKKLDYRLATFTLLAMTLATTALPSHAAGTFPSFLDNGIAPSEINGWAQAVVDYSPTSEIVAIDSFGGGPHNVPTRALGPSDGRTVSLGDLDADGLANGEAPGSITLQFGGYAFDAPGPDLAIFENALPFGPDPSDDFSFAELAFVEVSTDGVQFARFPATSLNVESPMADALDQLHNPFDLRSFVGLNTTNLNNLAGIHPAGFGTPFDLSDLASDPLVTSGAVQLDEIRFVRLIDIPGAGSVVDSLGNPILDSWHTAESGGLDLDGVGAINFVPEPGSLLLFAASLSTLLGGSSRRPKL